MSNEEIKEKLPNELVVFMEFMDSILQFYEFKLGNYKVIENRNENRRNFEQIRVTRKAICHGLHWKIKERIIERT